MDGKSLSREVLVNLGLSESDLILVDQTKVYRALDQAAKDFCRLVEALTSEASITTVAGEQVYDLPPDFLKPYVRGRSQRLLARYDRGGDLVDWPRLVSYQNLFLADLGSQEVPARFALRDRQRPPDVLTGTAGAESSLAVDGEAILHDPGADFSTWHPRDQIHNTSRDTSGLVLEVVDATHVRCALFPAGRAGFVTGDRYRLLSASGRELVLEGPALSSGHVLTLPYVCLPNPLYSELSSWRLADTSCLAIAGEAAFLYQVAAPGLKPNPALHALYQGEVQRLKIERAQECLHSGRRER